MSAIVMRGDARDLPLPDESVDLIVTSPPYFGLRSYTDGGEHYAEQIGSEATPKEYVAALLDCTREWVRVLKPGGSLFVNLGDKYSTYTGANWGNGRSLDGFRGTARVPHGGPVNAPEVYGIPYKSLMGLPWRYALGCIDDLGLTLRAEIVWSKTNGMPESAGDRARRAHEQVFHFARQPRYYSAADDIREPASGYERANASRSTPGGQRPRAMADTCNPLGRLPGSVWEIASQPLTVPASLGLDHFAAFPMELPRRCIAGWSPPGICTTCGEGRRPLVVRQLLSLRPGDEAGRARLNGEESHGFDRRAGTHVSSSTIVTGYACACPDDSAPTTPGVVLDPFGGTGTTALVADVLGRTGISVDRSADYCRLARWRTTDPGERAKAMQVPKPPPVPEGQGDLFAEAAS